MTDSHGRDRRYRDPNRRPNTAFTGMSPVDSDYKHNVVTYVGKSTGEPWLRTGLPTVEGHIRSIYLNEIPVVDDSEKSANAQ